jgi:hypothetical protein
VFTVFNAHVTAMPCTTHSIAVVPHHSHHQRHQQQLSDMTTVRNTFSGVMDRIEVSTVAE